MNPVGIGIIVLVLGPVVFFIVRAITGKSRRTMGRRMEDVIAGPSGFDAELASELEGQVIGTKRAERFQILADLFRGKTFFKKLELTLISSGVPLKPAEFLGLVGISTIVMALIGLFIAHKGLVITILFVIFGYKLPWMVLGFLKKRRIHIIEGQLSDSLTMIASGLKAGYGFIQGISAAGEQMPPPISDEFRRVVRSSQLGMDVRDALRKMGERVQSYDLDMAITACCVQLQTGGNLS